MVYSLTKIIGGYGTCIGWAVVDSGRFDWSKDNRYQELTEADSSYHGLNFQETFCQSYPDQASSQCPVYILEMRTGLLGSAFSASAASWARQ